MYQGKPLADTIEKIIKDIIRTAYGNSRERNRNILS